MRIAAMFRVADARIGAGLEQRSYYLGVSLGGPGIA
jgi:hypothetical protein